MSDTWLTCRAERDDDVGFLRGLYASTRVDELAPLGWTAAQLDAFVTMQFEAQCTHYRANYPDADFLVLTVGAERVGRLYVNRGPTEVLLIDIALLPERRGAGLGTALLRRLIDDAAQAGVPLRLSVDKTSRAFGLYQRLGFTPIGDQGVSWRMEWRPHRHTRVLDSPA